MEIKLFLIYFCLFGHTQKNGATFIRSRNQVKFYIPKKVRIEMKMKQCIKLSQIWIPNGIRIDSYWFCRQIN